MFQRGTNLSGGEYSSTSVALRESSGVKLRVRFDSIAKDFDINVPTVFNCNAGRHLYLCKRQLIDRFDKTDVNRSFFSF